MKHILSFILVSALVFGASANPFDDAIDFMDGFTGKVNITNPQFGQCRSAVNNLTTAFDFVTAQAQAMTDDDTLEQAVGELGYQFAHFLRVCSKAAQGVSDFFEDVTDDIVAVNTTDFTNRIMMNMFTLNMKFQAAKTAYANGDFKAVGQFVGDVYALVLYGEFTTRNIRQLSSFTAYARQAMNFSSTYLGFLGFIEEANTTVAINDYVAFANHSSGMIGMLSTLEDAITKMDFPTIISTVQQLKSTFEVVSVDAKTLGAEVSQFVERDLPLFETSDQLNKVVQYLMANMPTTITTVMRMSNAYKTGDFREFGHGTGAFYNLMRAGAMN